MPTTKDEAARHVNDALAALEAAQIAVTKADQAVEAAMKDYGLSSIGLAEGDAIECNSSRWIVTGATVTYCHRRSSVLTVPKAVMVRKDGTLGKYELPASWAAKGFTRI